ncbi:MAG: adenosylcobinamide-GDP ribazoletransferase [Verrucomicrobia bacterium]|nr:adenosylcobinamide-GDP ribazoletransferase [Verrucomicrobiota bacterium]
MGSPATLRTAVAFLTRLPAGGEGDGERLAASTTWFSLVGLMVGALSALPLLWLPERYAALASILITVLVTGAMHEDGLADTCDGLFGGADPDARRAIMRDSRIGSYGAIGLWMLLMARWLLLRDLAGAPWTLAAAAGFSRSAAVWLLANQRPVAMVDPGAKCSSAFDGVGWGRALTCFGIALAGAGVVFRSVLPVMLCAGATIAVSGLCGLFFHAKLGRLNGDALGAVIALSELACLAAIALV